MHSGRPKITEDIYKTTLESDKNYGIGGGILSGKTNKSQLGGESTRIFGTTLGVNQPIVNSDGSRREQRSQERSKSKGKVPEATSFHAKNSLGKSNQQKLSSVDKLIKKNIR